MRLCGRLWVVGRGFGFVVGVPFFLCGSESLSCKTIHDDLELLRCLFLFVVQVKWMLV